jgi:5,10-methenyltetrahydrofolate synthetase
MYAQGARANKRSLALALTPAQAAWRKQQRGQLLAARSAAAVQDRAAWGAAINASLREALDLKAPCVLGLCWPYHAEFDARALAAHLRARGVRSALPVVRGPGLPLEFRHWWPGAPMDKGVYDIPVPRATEVLVPDVLLVPPVGIDAQGFRLGYGGGYFDRTLAVLERKPVCIATAFELSRIVSLHPQAHDVRMDFVVTETGIVQCLPEGMRAIDATRCRLAVQQLLAERANSSDCTLH